ncbi:hypothetical protein SAMN04488542_11249 [Fontibacillus panacisegetis]|uniref:Uncharacterized protein n=1 Tax=Fontibacillus panacisegetis TaxID=670482 RepID=A0A1G7LSI3_9BACL|nr:hypothetical protein [Fontibacillus panacisegetis]SDF52472.1 hypothetical protein SAMN04488542_11249 [Fontibacillus panacisegetis]
MEKYESELTRRYLLNSHSRGSLEEVISDEEGFEAETEMLEMESASDVTRDLLRLYYE